MSTMRKQEGSWPRRASTSSAAFICWPPTRPLATKGRVGIADERPDDGDVLALPQIGKTPSVPSSPRVQGPISRSKPLKSARHIRVVVSGHEADLCRASRGLRERPGTRPIRSGARYCRCRPYTRCDRHSARGCRRPAAPATPCRAFHAGRGASYTSRSGVC